MIKHLFIALIILIAVQQTVGQQRNSDSLQKEIYQLPDDTSKVNKLNKLAANLFYPDPLTSAAIIKNSIAISEKIKYDFGLSVAYGLQANMLFYQMKLDSCRILVDKAYALVSSSKEIAHRNQAAHLLTRYAAIHQQKQNYDSAVQRYLEAAAIFSEIKDESKIIYSYYNLSGIYNFLEDYDKAIFYARETRRIALAVGGQEYVIRSLMAVSDAFVNLNEYDSVFLNAQKGLAMANEAKMTFAIGKFHSLLGIYYSKKKELYDSSIYHFNVALDSYKKIYTQYDIAIVLQNMGDAYLKMKDYPNATKYLKEALSLARDLKLDQVMHLALKGLVLSEEKVGDIQASLRYLKEYVDINDTLLKRNNRKIVSELETKYQTQKKEVLLQAQQKTIKQKNLLNYVLAGGVISILIIFFLSYRTYRQKQKLQEQRVNELETEKKLMATEAILKGEEKERTRIAKDLHDGLGGMLSGIKYSLNTMKGNLVMTPENNKAFERSIDMLDTSIKEMRRVAHNMMPEALVKFGLETALKDFCNDINQSGALHVSYQSIGMENTNIDQTTSIALYRIIQELINNSIKHAKARSSLVQISRTDRHLSVTVEDDGVGFDVAMITASKGIGWSNIQNRVEFLKGTMDIQSSPGKGTSVHIELNNVI